MAVRTQDKLLNGDHHVMLAVKAFDEENWQYTGDFYITVQDPCNPYDCTLTEFYPDE